MRIVLASLAASGLVTALVVATAPPATAAPEVTTLSTAYVDPTQLAVRGDRVLVTDGRRLTEVGRSRALAQVASGGDVAGVALGPGTAYAYGSSNRGRTDTRLTIVGSRTVVARLSAHERRYNPDRRVVYGVQGASKCVRDAFKALDGGAAAYTGRVGSHPAAVANSGANWYVADSVGNDVLRVYASGQVRTIAVLPRQPFTFTRRVVTGLGMPSCVVGARYQGEPAPTDVEVGPDGMLWVTTLPQLYDLGQPGSLYRIDPRTGSVRRFATGFQGATNVAVTASGKIFVAERLSGRVAAVRSSGRWSTYLALPGVLGLEAVGETLYASVAAPESMGVRTGPGTIVRIG